MYYNPQIEVLDYTTQPAKLIYDVARDSMVNRYQMKEGARETTGDPSKLVKYLYQADHGEPLRFAHLTCRVSGVSRAFMAQIRTWKHMSCVCSSQHYQDYRDYPFVCRPDCDGAVKSALQNYVGIVDGGTPNYEARMALPEAMCVTMSLTANAEAWANIIRRRLCLRNVPEMVIWAVNMRKVLVHWFPELFTWVGANCMFSTCREGFLMCKLSPEDRTAQWTNALCGEVL